MTNINTLLSKLYKKPLYIVGEELGYKKSNILILENKFDRLKNEFPEVWQQIISCTHNKDQRSFEDYSKDLVSSWILEDTLLYYLKKYGLDIKLNGTDGERDILANLKIRTDSDYLIKFKDKERPAELITSYTNYWNFNKKIDLRDNKYLGLKKTNSLLICVDLFNKNFFILDFQQNTYNIKLIPFHKPYNKAAYQISLENFKPIKLTITNLLRELKKQF